MVWIQKENKRKRGEVKEDIVKMNYRYMGVCGEVTGKEGFVDITGTPHRDGTVPHNGDGAGNRTSGWPYTSGRETKRHCTPRKEIGGTM